MPTNPPNPTNPNHSADHIQLQDDLDTRSARHLEWTFKSDWTRAALAEYHSRVRQFDENGVHMRDQLGPRALDAMFRMQITLCEISTHLEALFDSVSKLILSAELEQENELFKDLSKVQAVLGETKEYVFTEMEISQQKFMLQDLELKWGMTLTKTGRLIKMQGNLHKV